MKNLKFYLAGLALIGLTFYSCDNDDDSSGEFNDSEMLRTAAVIDRINQEDFQFGMETANDESALDSRPSDLSQTSSVSCATITQTSVGNEFPRTFEVDFGTGCTHNGITRSGKLIITFSDFLLATGSTMTIERENYVVNGYAIEGTVTFTNQTTGDVPQWTRTVTGGQVTTPDGGVYTHSGTRTIRQIEGASTPFIMIDNTFEVSAGSATVTRPNGSSLTATVTTPLIKHATCANISAGVMHLEGTFLNGDLDYGDDTCDNIAVYTHVDGTTHTVTLN
jgi:hypothetical protein